MSALCLALAAASCLAQSETGGLVDGRITGPRGAAVSGAAVRIENPSTGESANTLSDARGDFRFAHLIPGAYRLQVRSPGLSHWEADNLAVDMGASIRLHPALTWMDIHRTILVDASRLGGVSTASRDFGQGMLRNLPNNGQIWSRLAALFGAASSDGNGGVSFRGLSPLLNSIGVDGTNDTLAFRSRERAATGNGYTTAPSAISQFRVSGSGLAAPAGRGGGVFSTITKSGGSHLHGQAVFYDRGVIGQAYNAYTRVMQMEPAGTTALASGPVLYLDGQPITYVDVPYHAPDRRQQWSVSAGGPIRRGRLFWFLAWNQYLRNDPAVARAAEPEIFFSPPSASTLATLEARLQNSRSPIVSSCAQAGVPGGGSTAMAACAWATVLHQLNGLLGTVPRSSRQTILFPKLNWRINPHNQLVLQYNSMRRGAPHGALGAASEMDSIGSFGNSSTSDDTAMVRWDDFMTPQLVSSMRYQFNRHLLAQSPAIPSSLERQFSGNPWGLPPQVSIDSSSGFTLGTLSTVNKQKYPEEARRQFTDNVTWMRDRNTIRFGYSYNHVTDAIEGLNGENGAYSYPSLLNFISDMLAPDSCDASSIAAGPYPCYDRFRQTLGYTSWWFSTEDYAAYAADDWKPLPRLTLSLGLQYEYERLPNTNRALVNSAIPPTAMLPHNRDQFGPRFGFAWSLFGHRSTILQGGIGVFYARIPNATVFSALTATGSPHSPRAYSWRPTDAGAPPFPWVFSSTETPYVDPSAPDQATSAPDVVYFDRNFRHPQIVNAQLSLRQELGRRGLLTITGMATDGHHLDQFIDTNIDPTAVATIFYAIKAPGNEGSAGPLAKLGSESSVSSFPIYRQPFYYRRLNPSYGSITDILSESSSGYRGLMVRLIHRMSHALTANVGYTWSHAIDDNQTESSFAKRSSVYAPGDLRLEHGVSSFDIRQRVAGGIILRTPWRLHGAARTFLSGYMLAASGSWHTGLPYTMRILGALPTPSCSYADWINAGGATSRGSDCLQAVREPGAVIENSASVPIPGLGATLNGSGGLNLIPGIGRNTFRYPAFADLSLRFQKQFRLSERFSFDLLGDAFNVLNHRNVTRVQAAGYRLVNDKQHANMASLVWQSGVKPGASVVMVNGTSVRQYLFDPTAAFGSVTNANSRSLNRERQIQAGIKFNF